ncbi:MAG TPA: hypothetical protein PLJ60_19735 [Chryseolinea sp.]|nr:hypothetical protein [Chryseolinea sp.]HPM32575.1 hypothetical protein [Chryseolinea sp.]
MENNDTLNENFKNELETISKNTILDPGYRRKKLMLWFIRTSITVVLYLLFWKHSWVKWTLLLTIPLSIFSFFTIVGSPYLLKRKIEGTKQKLTAADKIINETENDGE